MCGALGDVFPESCPVGQFGLAQADDQQIWEAAKAGGFVLVSQDMDFAEMALLRGPPPKVLWLRCGNRPTAYVETLLRNRMDAIHALEADPNAVCLEVY